MGPLIPEMHYVTISAVIVRAMAAPVCRERVLVPGRIISLVR